MTWVVARSMPWGYAVGFSDIRVTLVDGTERDCLQKIYPVGQQLALGFAGSVAIGFSMVDRLSALLAETRPHVHWDPLAVADRWPGDARQVFDNAPQEERKLGCHLLLLGSHPTETVGPFPKCYVHRFEHPEFRAERVDTEKVSSIGSGEQAYAQAAQSLSQDEKLLDMEDGFLKMTGKLGGSAFGMKLALTRALEQTPEKGISRHLHICIVRREDISLDTNDRDSSGLGGDEMRMPPVATSLTELQAMLAAAGLSAAEARCTLP